MARVRQRAGGFDETAMMNNAAFYYYYTVLSNIALARYVWRGLPDTIDSRYLELTLMADGRAVAFVDDVVGALALAAEDGGNFTVYGIPANRIGLGYNGYRSESLDDSNSVMIYNNLEHRGEKSIITYFARRLWDIDRSVDVNARAQKTPVIVYGDEKEILTLKNVCMQADGNAPIIWMKKGLDLTQAIKTLDIKAPWVAGELNSLSEEIFSQALRALGVFSTRYKSERLAMQEASANLSAAAAVQQSGLQARIQAAKAMRRVFGWNVEVSFNFDINVPITDAEAEGGEASGEIHNTGEVNL